MGRTTNGQPARILAIMSDHDEDRSERLSALPSLPGEDFVCASCGLSFAEVSVERAIQAIRLVPGEVRGGGVGHAAGSPTGAAQQGVLVDHRIYLSPA